MGTSIASHRQTRDFYRGLAEADSRLDHFNLYILSLRGRLIAADFGLCAGRRIIRKCAYDEAFASWSPGHILTLLMLRDCIHRGIEGLDFC